MIDVDKQNTKMTKL